MSTVGHVRALSELAGPLLPSELSLRVRGSEFRIRTHIYNAWFLGPTRVGLLHIPNDISIGSAVFAALTIVTERQTDRQTNHATAPVTIGRVCIRIVLRCGLVI